MLSEFSHQCGQSGQNVRLKEAQVQQLLSVWNGLTLNRKAVVIGATAGMFLLILAMTRIVTAPSMALLYAGLDSSSAGEVVRALEQRGTAYDVRGGSIFVDAARRDELRMTLASEGLPANSSSGYELLDSLNGFGTTSQMFDAAYWRAKEGELARTIVTSPQITAARVHIAHGGSNPFQRGVEPTASVAISPIGGNISNAHAKSLKFLVASAVAGLSPDNVAVIGADGALLDAADGPDQTEGNAEWSDRLKQKAERLLEARVGVGNAIVEVSVDTVNEREEIRERRFDPETRVAISTDTEEVTNSSTQAGAGQVTIASNLPDGDAAGGENSSSQNNQTRERVNYEVSETEREIVRAPGAIKRLTVAVLVNGVPEGSADTGAPLVPRSDEELVALQELVESAVGFDAERGDVITVKSMGLQAIVPQGTAVEDGLFDQLNFDLMSAIQMAVLAVVTLILGLFVVRPIISGATASARNNASAPPALEGEQSSGGSPALPAPGAAGVGGDTTLPNMALAGAQTAETSDLPDLPMLGDFSQGNPSDRLRSMIEERQSETVEILRGWLEDEEETA